MRLQHTLYAQLPAWARPDHPVMRYARGQPMRRSRRWLLALLIVLSACGVVTISLIAYEAGDPLGIGDTHNWALFSVLYFPLLVLQFFTLTLAILVASTAISTEQQRGTWEDFKITSHGAELVMRARWAAVLYQLRVPLVVLTITRVIFAVLMLVDVTQYEGYHLDMYLYGITPDMPLEVAILLLAALMTALLLQVLVLAGLNAAVGLFLASVFHNRMTLLTVRFIALITEIVILALALRAGWHVLDDNPMSPATEQPSNTVEWATLVLMGTLGDQGLRFMDLETHLQTWADVNYAVLIGGVLLVAVIVEIGLIRLLLTLAARRASRPLRE